MLQTIKKVWIPCVIYWALLLLQLLFLYTATESWMMLAILVIVTFRLMLWVSPLALTAFVWFFGLMKPRCPVKELILVNIIVLVLDVLPFYCTYLLFGSWY